MALVPFSYNTRSLFVRRSATVLTVLSIGATVAVLAGVLALQKGFTTLFTDEGRDDVVVMLRPGATGEGDSLFARERAEVLMKSLPEIAKNEQGQPLASLESYLAVRLFKVDGGETNVPIRGVQPMTFEIDGDALTMLEGRVFEPGTDEVIVGQSLTDRIEHCRLDEVITINITPFRVVGVFAYDGPYESEIWGDVHRMGDALERPSFNRILAKVEPGVDVPALAERLTDHPESPAKLMTEREYLEAQTLGLSVVLGFMATFLAVVMGIAAVFTATNTMLAALSARTHEIGILLSLGFRPFAIFVAFMLEAMALGLIGGVVGCLMALPINGVRTGTTNFQTFTEVAFAFRLTPQVLVTAVLFALLLGLLGGAWPAFRASRMRPTQALRRM